MTSKAKSIGRDLIQESTGPAPKKRGISDELFPYILVASRNGMSSRAISRWLEEKKEIKLSAAMIAKVIRESNKRCLRLYEQMLHRESQLRSLTPLAGHMSLSPEGSYLFDRQEFESRSPYHMDTNLKLIAEECGNMQQMYDAYDFILEEWFSLPTEFLKECQRVVREQVKGE